MTQNSLIEIEYGSQASSQTLNDNFIYLEGKIGDIVSDTPGSLKSEVNSLASQVTTINSAIGNGATVPAGTIIMWGGKTSTPAGYLLCSGASVSKTTYPSLFAAIGYTYGGSGDNFNLPQISDSRFPMGGSTATAGNAAQTASRDVTPKGSISSAGTHTHSYGGMTNPTDSAGSHSHTFTGTSKSITDTTVPKSITLRFCIKY